MCLLDCLLVSKNLYNRARLGASVLDIHNPRRLISILIVSTFNLRILKKQYLSLSLYPYWSNPLAWYDYHISNKEKLICRLTKDQDQAMISIYTIQEFPAQIRADYGLVLITKKVYGWLNFLKISLKSISINTEGGVAALRVLECSQNFGFASRVLE